MHINHRTQIVVHLNVSEHFVEILLVLFEISIQEQVRDDAMWMIIEQQLIGVPRPLFELMSIVTESGSGWHAAIASRTGIATR